MSTFLNIPEGEIRNFLRDHQLEIPADSLKAYQIAWDYLIDHPKLSISSEIINDFLLAYHRPTEVTDRYARSTGSRGGTTMLSPSSSWILGQPDRELSNLVISLGLKVINRERIIRILGYLDLLDNDLSVFDLLPLDIWNIIVSHLDGQSLGQCGRVNKKCHSWLGNPEYLRDRLQIILSPMIRLDLSRFTLRELTFMCQTEDVRSQALSIGDHSLVLTSQGSVYSFGRGDRGQLGLGHTRDVHYPLLIDHLDYSDYNYADDYEDGTIIAVSTGWRHSLLLNSRGQVLSCGDNQKYQLGLRDDLGRLSSRLIRMINLGNGKITIPESMVMTAVSAGGEHSLILNSQGQVFSFGEDYDFGSLGLGYKTRASVPTLISEFQRIDDDLIFIVAISAGGGHSLLLDSQGLVYSFGFNEDGQLGLGDHDNRSIPHLITDFNLIEDDESSDGSIPTIIAISAGHHHSLFLDSRGRIFGVGSNCHDQLGLVGLQPISIPMMADISEFWTIIAISAGYSHSLLLSSQGEVILFGYCGPINSNRAIPIVIRLETIGKVIAISAGDGNSLVSNDKGQVFSFGSNGCGQLGLGDKENRSSPTLVPNLSLEL
jgi:alpha-tubulin suppressor-like RCC1 family protein